jgi:hypothetical protein
VLHTPQSPSQDCPHERGPGTTLCLHCRREARLVAQVKRKKLMLRGTAAAIVIGTSLAASAMAATAMRGRSAARRTGTSASRVVVPTPVLSSAAIAVSSRVDSTLAVSAATDSGTSATNSPAAASPSIVVAPEKAPLSPVIPSGSSPLTGGLTVFRADSVVTVSFDLPMQRTRIPEKFEHLVRTSLPAVYGPAMDSILTKVAIGALAGQGNLLTELPTVGVRIPVSSSWEVRVYPETRKGQDGPLVVRYRSVVCVTRDSACGTR